ncbi:phosphatase PAP2 family protein [Vibrio sp. DNB22_19_1]
MKNEWLYNMLVILYRNLLCIPGLLRQEATNILKHIQEDSLIYAIISIICLSVTSYSYFHGYKNKVSFFAYANALPIIIWLTVVLLATIYFFILIKNKEPRPLLCYWYQIKRVFNYRAKIISAFMLLTALSLFISSFSTAKSMIPLVNPFKYDALFHDIDAWIFGGQAPWTIVHRVLDSPFLTMIINYCYNIWFLLQWGILCYFILASRSKQRSCYLVSWILCWLLLGMIAATILSSAGPAFLSRLDSNIHDYDELMNLLHQQHDWLIANGYHGLFALDTQDELWDSYANGKEMLGGGISAMPSMHVSMSVLMALGMNSVNRTLGLVFGLYGGVILVGSVALGWHYFSDGLVSIVLTVLIWKMSLMITQRQFESQIS